MGHSCFGFQYSIHPPTYFQENKMGQLFVSKNNKIRLWILENSKWLKWPTLCLKPRKPIWRPRGVHLPTCLFCRKKTSKLIITHPFSSPGACFPNKLIPPKKNGVRRSCSSETAMLRLRLFIFKHKKTLNFPQCQSFTLNIFNHIRFDMP